MGDLPDFCSFLNYTWLKSHRGWGTWQVPKRPSSWCQLSINFCPQLFLKSTPKSWPGLALSAPLSSASRKGAAALPVLTSARIQFSPPCSSGLQFYVTTWQLWYKTWADGTLKNTNASNGSIFSVHVLTVYRRFAASWTFHVKNPVKTHLAAVSLLGCRGKDLGQTPVSVLTLLYKWTLSNKNLVPVLLAFKFKPVRLGSLRLRST